MYGFLKGNQLMLLYWKPDPLVTHSEPRVQIQSYLSRFQVLSGPSPSKEYFLIVGVDNSPLKERGRVVC
jgi:hypothetical protein